MPAEKENKCEGREKGRVKSWTFQWIAIFSNLNNIVIPPPPLPRPASPHPQLIMIHHCHFLWFAHSHRRSLVSRERAGEISLIKSLVAFPLIAEFSSQWNDWTLSGKIPLTSSSCVMRYRRTDVGQWMGINCKGSTGQLESVSFDQININSIYQFISFDWRVSPLLRLLLLVASNINNRIPPPSNALAHSVAQLTRTEDENKSRIQWRQKSIHPISSPDAGRRFGRNQQGIAP